MKRNRRFAVDYSVAEELLIQSGMSRDDIINQLISKAYFAYMAPDLLDHVSSLLTYPILYIRHVIYEVKKKESAEAEQ